MRPTILILLASLAGLSPAMAADFALHRAIVDSNGDPMRAYRLLVHIPDRGGAAQWASPSVPYTDDPRTIALPPAGATVWILFEDGDMARPVWIGWQPGAAPSRHRRFERP